MSTGGGGGTGLSLELPFCRVDGVGLEPVRVTAGDAMRTILTAAVAGAILVGGGIALWSSGAFAVFALAGTMAVHAAEDRTPSAAMPIETFRIGATLDRRSGRIEDTAAFSIATEQVRGLSDLEPRLEQRYRGRALTLPLEGGRHLVVLLFGSAQEDSRSPLLPWTSAGPGGVIPRERWPMIGIWDGVAFRELDHARLPDELGSLRIVSTRNMGMSMAPGDAPPLLEGRDYLVSESKDGHIFRLGVARDEFQRKDF